LLLFDKKFSFPYVNHHFYDIFDRFYDKITPGLAKIEIEG